MSSKKHKHHKKGKSIASRLLYIVLVIVLLICIFFLYILYQHQQAGYEEVIGELEEEEEAGEYDVADTSLLEGESDTSETEAETQAETEIETEAESETEETVDYGISIVVLNGTGTSGVAADWQSSLQEAGYTDVIAATYGEEAQSYTIIVADTLDHASSLMEIFPDAEVRVGTELSGSVSSDEEIPEDVNVWIIIGTDDVGE